MVDLPPDHLHSKLAFIVSSSELAFIYMRRKFTAKGSKQACIWANGTF
jgi:hypothetical protein